MSGAPGPLWNHDPVSQAWESSNCLGKRAVPHSDSGSLLCAWPVLLNLEGWLVKQAVGAAVGAHCSAALLWGCTELILHTWLWLQFPG